jgi:Spy/CpxP family protein refolding chaperone
MTPDSEDVPEGSMNAPASSSSAGPGARAGLISGRTLAALVLLLILLTGGLAGIAVDRLVLLPQHFGRPPFGHGPPRGRRPFGEERGFRERFARELGLSAEQQTRIDSIMGRQIRTLREIREQARPRIDSVLAETRRQIDAVLTPAQRQKAEALRKADSLRRERHGPWMGPPGMGPPGMGPPGGPGDMGPPPPPGGPGGLGLPEGPRDREPPPR